jgi:class 3 adenylate cyclase
VETPETHYAHSGDVNIAYQVLGDGPFDLVFVPGSVSHVELLWQVPAWAAFDRRLASFSRLILLDKRGTGMSDRVSGAPTLETRMDDVRAVMDAVGSQRAALLGLSEGGSMSALFAATYPDRTWALVLCGAPPRTMWAPDYPWGWTEEAYRQACEEEDRRWGEPAFMKELVRGVAPSLDDENIDALATLFRQTTSPGTWAALNRMNMEIDVRDILSAIRVPTLVLNRAEEEVTLREGSRFMAATVLFTDIVGSTAKAAELGDARWRELLSQHHALIRRQLLRFRGVELDTAGDGFFASFDGPARAIRCACAITQAVKELGLEVRAGLHTGECERLNGKVGGIAVHIGARVAKEARPGEVLVSSTVKDLVAGSGLQFDDRGATELKGVPGEWRLFSVEP